MDLQALETHSDTIAKVAVPLALVCWLAYLSVEQFYFFADNEQLISDLTQARTLSAWTQLDPAISEAVEWYAKWKTLQGVPLMQMEPELHWKE